MTTSTDSASQEPPDPADATTTPPWAEDCAALPLDGTPELLRDGPDSLVVRDDGGESATGRVFHLPRHEAAAAAHLQRTQVLPYLRGHLSPAIPLPESGSSAGARWGFTVAPYLAGHPLHASAINVHNEARLARDLGCFLAELHAYPAERAQALGAPGPRDWRESLDGLRRRSLKTLRPELGITDTARLRRWWTSTLADEAWTFTPGLAHANLAPQHLLLDGAARSLDAVLGWSALVVADSALDIAALSHDYGADFAWLVLEAYRHAGGGADAAFLMRVRRQSALLPFLDWGRTHGSGEPVAPEATQRLIERLRAGSVLSAGSASSA